MGQVVVGILAEDNPVGGIPGVADHCNRLGMIAEDAGDADGFRIIVYFPNTRDLPADNILPVEVLAGVL